MDADEEKNIAVLTKKVNSFISKENTNTTNNLMKKKSLINKFNPKILLYFVFPIIILIILIVCKPKFILKEDSDIKNKINIKKIIIYTILLSVIADIGLFLYFKYY